MTMLYRPVNNFFQHLAASSVVEVHLLLRERGEVLADSLNIKRGGHNTGTEIDGLCIL